MKHRTVVRNALAAVALCSVFVQPTAAQEVTLRAVSFMRTDIDAGLMFKQFVEQLNKEGQGVLRVRLQGGPEVINPFELGNALKSGVVDFAQIPTAFYASLFPAGIATVLAGKNPLEQRKNGAYDYLNQLHAQAVNAHILANLLWGMPNHIYLAKKTAAVERGDMSGLKLRAVPVFRPFFDALGATSINMNQADVYTAMERGTIDGYGYVLWGIKEQGWLPVTKYRIDPGFNNVTLMYLVNIDKWKSLTDAQRSLLTRLSIEQERRALEYVKHTNQEERRKQKEGGVQAIELKGEAGDKFVRTAKEAGWADVKAKAPQHYEKLRALLE